LDKKQQVVFYVPNKDILKFGNVDKFKAAVNDLILKFGESKVVQMPPQNAYDAPKIEAKDLKDEPSYFGKAPVISNYNHHVAKISRLVFPDDKTEYMYVVQEDETLSDKEREKLLLSLKF